MRTLRIVLVAAAVVCAVVVGVGGYRLAGAVDAPSLGRLVVVEPSTTTLDPPRRAGPDGDLAGPGAHGGAGVPATGPGRRGRRPGEDEDADDLDGD